ncbi:ribonuclease HI [Saccharopolyspora mangrovi]|uniref:ribonuclease HI n=1 Tax=Saccharopolyspora mangrovi TaxID=3082379 RepID=UPI00389A2984
MTERVIAATDGSAQPNPGPTGWAWVLGNAQGRPSRGESGFLGNATNNIGELTAVAELLDSTDPGVPLEIRIDSQYAMNVVTGRSGASKNLDLAARIQRMLSGRDVTFKWVPAHQADGDLLNAHADHAAQEAVRSRRGRRWTGPAANAISVGQEPVTPDRSRASNWSRRRGGRPGRPSAGTVWRERGRGKDQALLRATHLGIGKGPGRNSLRSPDQALCIAVASSTAAARIAAHMRR